MKLSECKIGEIVTTQRMFDPELGIGHIVDLEVNDSQQVIPLVKFAKSGETRGIHPCYLQLLSEVY